MTNPQPNPHYEPDPERGPYVLFTVALIFMIGIPLVYFLGVKLADQFECTGYLRLAVIWFWWIPPVALIAVIVEGWRWCFG